MHSSQKINKQNNGSANIVAECKRRFMWVMLITKYSIVVSRSYQDKVGLTLG